MSPAGEPKALPRWWLALVVGLPVVLGALNGAHRRTFDAWVHIFFADHYLRGWFEVWEPRWYGGFSVLTYPPLAHQLVAAAASVVGHETGFVLVMGLAMALTPIACGAFARALFGAEAVPWVVTLAALWPTSHRFAYVYGQLPMMVATPLALFAMATLANLLRDGRLVQLGLLVALVGATAATHHVSTLFVAFGCAIVGLGQLLSAPAEKRALVLGRAVVAAVGCAGAIAGAIWPFFRYAAQAPQEEIPHISRDPLWLRPFGLEVVEQYALIALGVVAVVATLVRWRPRFGLAAGVLFFAVLSAGFTTPLPQLLFRSQARWLTYDKFHHWAALWFCVLVAPLLGRLGQRGVVVAAALLWPASLLQVGHKASDALQPEYVKDLAPLLSVVGAPGAESYRHLALGFGDQFCRLDIFGRSPNVDGDYHTARNDPVLRASGVATLDASKYYPKGPEVLSSVLTRADALSLKWVFVNDTWYYEPVLNAGFELKDVWPNGVTVFEKSDVPAIVPAAPQPELERWGRWWGLVPMSFLGLTLALAAVATRRRPPEGAPPVEEPLDDEPWTDNMA